MPYKQAILIRSDIKMSKGKTAAQAAHASLDAALRVMQQDNVLRTRVLSTWRKEGAKKVVLKVSNESSMFKLKSAAERSGIKVAIIKDAGLTEIPPGTYTALAIGPDKETRIDKIVGDLPIL